MGLHGCDYINITFIYALKVYYELSVSTCQ